MSTPTQRTLAAARELGWHGAVVEKWNHFVKRRQDLMGCIDVILWRDGSDGVLGVQATSGTNHAARVSKIRTLLGEREDLRQWLMAGNRVEVWSWSKMGKAGKRKTWTLRREGVGLDGRDSA